MKAALRVLAWSSLSAATIALFSCRDDVAPFEATDREPISGSAQLTFSVKDDRSPSWTLDGDSVYYSAEGFGRLPADPGVLVGMPQEGGVASEILTNVQIPDDSELRWLVAPTVAPHGERLAYVEIEPLWTIRVFCDPGLTQLSCIPDSDPPRNEAELPPLRTIRARVRRLDATGPIADDPGLEVGIPGVIDTTDPFGGPRLLTVQDYPFQQLFDTERGFVFRASWAPDGEQLVLSDGLHLLIWTVESGRVDTIPGSEDGTSPAWSPDGEWIAFTRLERANSSNVTCIHSGGFGPVCVQERTEYIPGRRVLTLIRPDGTALSELGDGDEPAWAPDGESVFFRRGGQIWRIARDGTAAQPIAGTEGGREPAVSPDGRSLAFSRPGFDGNFDIWKVELVPQP